MNTGRLENLSLYNSEIKMTEMKVEIDSRSLMYIERGMSGQRYAVIGFLDNGVIKLRFRPGFLDDDQPDLDKDVDEYFENDEHKAAQAEKNFFTRKNIVLSKRNHPGMVHNELLDRIFAEEPELFFANDGSLRKLKKIGFSVKKWEIKGEEYSWANRSGLNREMFAKKALPLAYLSLSKTLMLGKHEFEKENTDAHGIERSIPKEIFPYIATEATKIIMQGKKPTLELDYCLSFEMEDEWSALVSDPRAHEKIETRLIKNLYIAILAECSTETREYLLQRLHQGFLQAKALNIPINLELIPTGFDQTALGLAKKLGHKNFVEMLRSIGAKESVEEEKEHVSYRAARRYSI